MIQSLKDKSTINLYSNIYLKDISIINMYSYYYNTYFILIKIKRDEEAFCSSSFF
jgi:hypothetical protein